MSIGYRGTLLSKKLGIREGEAVVTIGAPPNYATLVRPLADGAKIGARMPKVVAFVHRRELRP